MLHIDPVLNPPTSDLHFFGFLLAGFLLLFWTLFIVPHYWEKPVKPRIRRRDAGIILMVEMIVVCAVVLLLVSVPLLNLQQIAAANNSTAVITVIRATNRSEGFFARVYGEGYQTPAYLAIQPTQGQSCATPSLLGNQDASAFSVSQFSNYQLIFTAGGSSGLTGSGCPGPGLASYTITATPLVPLGGTNSFFTDDTGILRCDSPTVTATAASPVCGF